ncbi:MAG: DoxX family protein [Bacteroidota bacterium]
MADWFPKDVSKFGFPFDLAPRLFAWLATATEAICGLFLAIGLGTRILGGLLLITMLAAIFYRNGQKRWSMQVVGLCYRQLIFCGYPYIALF